MSRLGGAIRFVAVIGIIFKLNKSKAKKCNASGCRFTKEQDASIPIMIAERTAARRLCSLHANSYSRGRFQFDLKFVYGPEHARICDGFGVALRY